MSWYCDAARGHPVHGPYHDHEYGFPLSDEAALFERFSLEIFQAGLSWLLVLKRRSALQAAFDGFDVDRVAGYDDTDVGRLLADPGIIRNRSKVMAIIDNASRVRAVRNSHGSFDAWIASRHPQRLEAWVKMFRATFRFAGPEVVREFLTSIGYLPGAHRIDCPVHASIALQEPPWMRTDPRFYE